MAGWLMFLGTAFSQTKTVSGTVSNEFKEPVAGVTVAVKNGSAATATNAQGHFSITVPENAILEVTSVGYTTQEISVAGRTSFDVTLSRSAGKQMDEVVVIGYGTASKRDLTGSIAKVSGREVSDKPNTNPVESLQGKVAGLTIVGTGTPGKAPDIRIRGTNSLGNNIRPLYVVDGIWNDNIDFLNPADIESMEVLKDPSSLAIFGARGANGVIMVSTKKGKTNQTVLNFNSSYGFKKLVDKIQWTSMEDFRTLFEEEKVNINANSPFDYGAWNANTDWVDAVTRTGQFVTTNLSLTTATAKNKFYLGTGFTKDQGIIKREELQKYQLNVSDEVKVNNWLRIGFSAIGTHQKLPYGADWVLDAARKVIPGVPAGTINVNAKNPYGIDSMDMPLYYALPVIQNSGVVNPLLILENEWDKTIRRENRLVSNIFLEFTINPKLTFRTTGYADMSNLTGRVYTPLYLAYFPEDQSTFLNNRRTQVNVSDEKWRKFQTDNILTYRDRFGAHSLTSTVGFTTYEDKYFGNSASVLQSATGQAIPNDPRFWYINNGIADAATARSSSGQRERTNASFLARALYNYDQKYFLNASFRYDGTSAWRGDNKWQPFWAVGAAWDISREEFMAASEVFDLLKLRASTGVLGVQNTGGYDYPAYPLLSTGTAAVFGNNVYTSATQQYLADPLLKWETNHATDVGVEMDLLNRRLHFEAGYYVKTTKNLLSRVPGTGAISDGLKNQGSLRNSGFEFSSTFNQKLAEGLNMTISGNLTTFKNQVLELVNGSPIYDGPSITAEGSPIGSFYGYIVEGLYQSYADKLKSPINTEFSYGPGDFKFRDFNGDGIINAQDKSIIGNPTPDFSYGGSLGLNYKGFDVGVDFGGVYGNEIFRAWGATESPFQRVNYPAFKMNRWHGEGTSNWDPILGMNHRINYEASTYSIEDGSYFRIRNLQMGYNIPTDLISKIKARSFRIFANAQNLKTWKRNSGYSPEFGGSATQFGVDYAGNALPRVITFGINVNF